MGNSFCRSTFMDNDIKETKSIDEILEYKKEIEQNYEVT